MTVALDRASSREIRLCDGRLLLGAFTAAANLLIARQRQLNALNVYPYPDGDTGTNMALTIRAALDEANKLAARDRRSATAVAAAIERGSLMGARGNSGVILSQMFRGFARAIAGRDAFDGSDLAAALVAGAEAAYSAVMEPVEGTMLTVIRVAAEQAADVARTDPSLTAVIAHALTGAETALADTPNLLAKLREAGVVDSGGQGIVYLFDGFGRFIRGEAPAATEAEGTGDVAESMEFLDRIAEFHADDEFGYCTNFMIFGSDIPFERVRRELAGMGSSAVIVGHESLVKVHIHTDNPGRLLSHAIAFGELGQIKIDNMNSQLESLIERRASAATLVLPSPAVCGTVAVVAVASGSGIAEALRGLGACLIVDGGQSMNPSVEQILAAIDAAPADEVVILPNNKNVMLAAERASELASKAVAVVPTRSIPQALAALEAFNDDLSLPDVVEAMSSALAGVRSVEITRAERDAQADGIAVRAGAVIGIVDDRIAATGEDEVTVAVESVAGAGGGEAELITVFVGLGGQADADPIAEELARTFPEAEIQVYDGGQPHYRYVIAVE